jgi:hypothetical protein
MLFGEARMSINDYVHWIEVERPKNLRYILKRIRIYLVLILLIGIGLVGLGLSENIIRDERWSNAVIGLGVVLIAFALVDVILHSVLETAKHSLTGPEKVVLDALTLADETIKKWKEESQEVSRKSDQDFHVGVLREFETIQERFREVLKKLEHIEDVTSAGLIISDPARSPSEIVKTRVAYFCQNWEMKLEADMELEKMKASENVDKNLPQRAENSPNER